MGRFRSERISPPLSDMVTAPWTVRVPVVHTPGLCPVSDPSTHSLSSGVSTTSQDFEPRVLLRRLSSGQISSRVFSRSSRLKMTSTVSFGNSPKFGPVLYQTEYKVPYRDIRRPLSSTSPRSSLRSLGQPSDKTSGSPVSGTGPRPTYPSTSPRYPQSHIGSFVVRGSPCQGSVVDVSVPCPLGVPVPTPTLVISEFPTPVPYHDLGTSFRDVTSVVGPGSPRRVRSDHKTERERTSRLRINDKRGGEVGRDTGRFQQVTTPGRFTRDPSLFTAPAFRLDHPLSCLGRGSGRVQHTLVDPPTFGKRTPPV